MRKLFRGLAGLLTAGAAALFAFAFYLDTTLPDKYMITEGGTFNIANGVNVVAKTCLPQTTRSGQVSKQSGNTFQAELDLFGVIPLKEVTVQVVDEKMVAACGSPFGIKMFTEGVMVVGLSDLDTAAGLANPAKQAGIQVGDVLLTIDNIEMESNEQVAEIVSQCGGQPLDIALIRNGQRMHTTLYPALCQVNASYKAGMWVRDSSAGIGTMTFYDPVSGVFGGLGHAVCDVDTGNMLPMLTGEAVQVRITGVVKGQSGEPGELQGDFYENSSLGRLYLNSETGVYGTLGTKITPPVLLPIAFRQEVKAAPATILSTLNGTTPEQFDIVIEKVSVGDNNPTKNLVIRVTDPRLLARTGGIVQGMSGSPILQDGKLIGAVTHVFVNDPTRGYGIFAENMYYSVDNVEKAIKLAS